MFVVGNDRYCPVRLAQVWLIMRIDRGRSLNRCFGLSMNPARRLERDGCHGTATNDR